jgi:hypothetical protein
MHFVKNIRKIHFNFSDIPRKDLNVFATISMLSCSVRQFQHSIRDY